MKNAIILHGCPEKEFYYKPSFPSESNAHWLPWLQKELIIRDIKADTPDIPHSYEPHWDTWVKEVERYEITPETLLVGHSAGGGFWLKYLSINPHLKVGKVVLVAPWLDPEGTIAEQSFYEFEYDPEVVSRTNGMTVLMAVDDSDTIKKSVEKIRKEVKDVRYKELPEGYGHFTYCNLKSEKFPELLAEIIN